MTVQRADPCPIAFRPGQIFDRFVGIASGEVAVSPVAKWSRRRLFAAAEQDLLAIDLAAIFDRFLKKMYGGNDFVFTVPRDFVRACQTPVLVLPYDVPAHPYAVALETAMLAPNSQVSLYPWKDIPERVPVALRHVRMFLNTHRPT